MVLGDRNIGSHRMTFNGNLPMACDVNCAIHFTVMLHINLEVSYRLLQCAFGY